MNEELLKVIRQLKDEILLILTSYDLTQESHARVALDRINALYDKLGIVVEDVVPPMVLQSYLAGTGGSIIGGTATFGGSLYAVTEITDNTMLSLRAAIRTAKKNTNNAIASALKDVQKELRVGVASGAKKRKATAKVAEAFDKHGMNSFTTIDGKELPLDFYAEVVTRTNMQSAEVKGSVDWIEDNGSDLIIINGVTPTCGQCYAHRGVVFSISGKDKRFQPAKDNLPPYHPNCMCYAEEYKEDEMDGRYVDADIEKSQAFDPGKDNRPDNIKNAYDKRQAMNRKNNYEKKAYARLKASLGEDDERLPKTIGAFKRLKRSNSQRYKDLLKSAREVDAE